MPDKVRVGIVGTGWGVGVHGGCLLNCPEAEIVALCGRQEDKTRAAAKELGDVAAYTDYRAMFERKDIDAVVVCTPDDTHHRMTLDALELKLHILCEKPLATNAPDAREMWQGAVAAEVKHMTAFSWHWIPYLQYVRQLIADGYVGTPTEIDCLWRMHFRLTRKEYVWRRDSDHTQGPVADLGSHMFYAARALCGPVASVQASLRTHTDTGDPGRPKRDASPDYAMTVLGFESGCHGVVSVSQAAMPAGELSVINVFGGEGTVRLVGQPEGFALYGQRIDESEAHRLRVPPDVLGDFDQPAGWLNRIKTRLSDGTSCAGSLVRAVTENRPAVPDFEEGYRVQQIIDASVESSRTGSRIEIEQSPG